MYYMYILYTYIYIQCVYIYMYINNFNYKYIQYIPTSSNECPWDSQAMAALSEACRAASRSSAPCLARVGFMGFHNQPWGFESWLANQTWLANPHQKWASKNPPTPAFAKAGAAPGTTAGVEPVPFPTFKRLKPSAAASTRHSGHSHLGLLQPSATITAFELAVCQPSNAQNPPRQLRPGTLATGVCC